MAPIKAIVRNGKLVIDEPTTLPEGTEVELFAADGWDDLDEDERKRLHNALAASEDDIAAGRVRSADDVLSDLERTAR